MAKKKFLGELLMDADVISQDQLDEALKVAKKTGEKVGSVLKDLGFVTESQIMQVLEFQMGIEYVDLNRVYVSPDMAKYVPANIARQHNLAPVRIENGELLVATEEPYAFIALDDVEMVSGMRVKPVLSKNKDIRQVINTLYSNEYAERAIEDLNDTNDLDAAVADLADVDEDDVNNAPIVRLVNSMVEQAMRIKASDIHVEPNEHDVRVRMRVDGKLIQTLTIPSHAQSAVTTRIKILGGMDIANKRIPQDGRHEVRTAGSVVDLRLSTMPTVYGEKVVIRLLDRSSFMIPKEKLGFTEANLKKFAELLSNTNGIILVTGPTGSGKSTTLYTMLNELNIISENIITVEDPVEYIMKGINQVNVNPKSGLTFANALRSVLRQDPDIIMIGEMRDTETVDIAVRAAITGHLVLSTLHTNDSPSTITRLMDMGVEPFMLATALVGIISQRLLRKICPGCMVEYLPDAAEKRLLDIAKSNKTTKIYKGTGCARCSETGYSGRLAIHEVLKIDREHRDMINSGKSVDEIRDYSVANGMSQLSDESIRLVLSGITTIEEATNIIYSQKG